MASMFQKASTFLGGGDGDDPRKQDEEGESLTSVLETDEDRSSLTILVSEITELMRRRLVDTFDPKQTGSQDDHLSALASDNCSESENLEMLSDEEQEKRAQKVLEKQKAEFAKREKEVSKEEMVTLKASALEFFDGWRDAVVLRVGEVVNSRKTAAKQSKQADPELASSETEPGLEGVEADEHEDTIAKALLKTYPPVETALCKIPKEKRILILHSVLLLLLSLEHYNAYSRVLLLHLTTSLGLSATVLAEDETKVAHGLLSAAEKMSADDETKKRAEENRTARRWKMGVAGVAGAALIGITGGLAAPLLASGLGTVLGGIGLGATATAGYLGALAGSGVLVGGLFGAYGAKMTSKAMEKYTRDVEDCAFVPIERPGKTEIEARRLRIAIGISGWLDDKDDVVKPWKCIGSGQESFALRFELDALINLGNALTTLVTSAAWSYAKSEIIKRTVFAALSAGLWPLGLVKASHIIDNPWSIANQRAQKAGEVLADALINKAQGERPVTLIGYSLGAKVIYVCLQQLAKRQAFGIVENAIMLGAPTPSSSADWRRIRSVVAGRVVNAYSANDYILAFLYRSSSIQFGVAGLRPVLDVQGVENVDVGDLVKGHTLYRHATAPVLKRIGFEDIDLREIRREEDRLAEQEKKEEEQRRSAESGGEKEGADPEVGEGEDREVRRMERDVEQMKVSE
ncbi:DUF726-domain-containing protein [Daldinia caldariorum]|uniref:DUF726-domain-containing protein n=1 Tax=Daldinia caldariorum TaxID=326644 RepID=UPI00200805B5|nr:DUF726-domain-containing protein [Daldinia caldariorum]KAI1471305.1 DUF726-domain-containing protein [Daldinia caldariorum]